MAESKAKVPSVDECFGLVLLYISKLLQEAETPVDPITPVTPELLDKLSQSLTHEISKYVISLNKTPSPEVVVKGTDLLIKQITNAACILRSLLGGAGPCMKKHVVDLERKVLTGIQAVVHQVRADLSTGGTVTSAQLTGIVWEHCKELVKVPLTNAAACGKELLVGISLVKDAREELAELKQEKEEGEDEDEEEEDEKADGGGEGDEGDFDDDDDDEESQLTPEEFKAVPIVQDLLLVAEAVLKVL